MRTRGAGVLQEAAAKIANETSSAQGLIVNLVQTGETDPRVKERVKTTRTDFEA